ncbi:hypothetical protein [Natrinema sp. HArc-T2]|uniref:hypothetical protein n=1 Tax=Natrinema sp. HArc-T2 TaxID=3242701 RepID=UPI00359ED3BB
MELRRDERAVTVQIGAVLLLAIVFTALALYQVNAVPAENSAVEYEHNQQVNGELQELRNGIRNAGMTNTSRSASVTLGTQYPTRTFSMNPSDPTGRLETITPSSMVRIEPANDTQDYAYETRFLAYEPDYNEYTDAPRTVIEHSLLYNQHDGANVSIGSQQLIQNERITLVLLDGNLSKTSSGVTSVSLEPLDGTRTRDLAAGTVITLPTERPAIWVDQLEDNSGVTVREAADGKVTLELNRQYTLEIARVGVGDDASSDEGFTIGTEKNVESSDRTSSGYSVSFDDPQSATPCTDGSTCDYTISAGTDTTFSASATAREADLDFAYSADENVSVERFNESPTDVEIRAQGSDGALIDLFVSSGGSSDTIQLRIVKNAATGPQFERLEAEVTGQRGGPTSAEATEVTFGYELSTDADDVVVTIEDQIGQEATNSGATAGGEFHGGQTVSFNSGNQPTENYPVVITVDIVNGECRTAELENFEDVASLDSDDWQSC